MNLPGPSDQKDIRSVVFDFGGVLAEEGFREGLKEIARREGLDPERFFELGAEAVYASGYVLGKGREQDFWALMCRDGGLPAYRPEFTRIILERFRLRPAMLEAVRRLRQAGYLLAILSDQTDWLDRLEIRDGFLGEFDRVYNSYHLGKGKRDATVFTDLVTTLRLAPGQVLFVDDNPGHVERARAEGLHALVFTGQRELLEGLETLLGLQLAASTT